jgi:hypothetical protein
MLCPFDVLHGFDRLFGNRGSASASRSFPYKMVCRTFSTVCWIFVVGTSGCARPLAAEHDEHSCDGSVQGEDNQSCGPRRYRFREHDQEGRQPAERA